MRILFFLVFSFVMMPGLSFSKEKKIIYKYKQYEKFDFDTMSIAADASNPGDLSISPRFRKDFANALPERKDFSREIRRSIQRIR